MFLTSPFIDQAITLKMPRRATRQRRLSLRELPVASSPTLRFDAARAGGGSGQNQHQPRRQLGGGCSRIFPGVYNPSMRNGDRR